jgi:hypothetical protein
VEEVEDLLEPLKPLPSKPLVLLEVEETLEPLSSKLRNISTVDLLVVVH